MRETASLTENKKSGTLCEEISTAAERRQAAPRIAEGPAVDPIHLAAVDEVTVTTLVDNTYDGFWCRPAECAARVSTPEWWPPKG